MSAKIRTSPTNQTNRPCRRSDAGPPLSWQGAKRDATATAAAMLAVTVIALFSALEMSSRLAQTSDSAQGFVVGHAIANGNVFLSGWHFPIDPFYFTDSLPYAFAEL